MAVPNSYGNIFNYSRTKTQAGTAQTPNATPKTFNNIFNYERATDNTRLQAALDAVNLAGSVGASTQSAIEGSVNTTTGLNEITNWNNPALESASIATFDNSGTATAFTYTVTENTIIGTDVTTGLPITASTPSYGSEYAATLGARGIQTNLTLSDVASGNYIPAIQDQTEF